MIISNLLVPVAAQDATSKEGATRVYGEPMRQPTIILIHGLHDGPGVWDEAGKFFDEVYSGVVHKFDYSRTTDDYIESNAGRFEAWLSKEGIDGSFAIIAHSMGGLVARYAMAHGTIRNRVRYLVTLGTPNYGTELALACVADPENTTGFCGYSTQEMKVNSDFLQHLNGIATRGDYLRDTMTYSIAGDGMVYWGNTSSNPANLPQADNRNIDCKAEELDGTKPDYECYRSPGDPKIHTSITRKKQVIHDALSMIEKVTIPPSAYGWEHTVGEKGPGSSNGTDPNLIEQIWSQLEEEVRTRLSELFIQGNNTVGASHW